ncbi:MAG: 3-isopropylmalate dehydratase small subunit [Chloroflexi bacterium]|nr:3-isopropylmalate dehydratase small subunit [Chloroflexota bacterium]
MEAKALILKGYVHKYGANVDTDVIIPARYLYTSEPAELAPHCMEDIDPSFQLRVKPGDIIVATTNFGCGSSREHAPIAIKAVGISCVIAQSFARIFYRNSMNMGLPILESDEAVAGTEKGDELEVDLTTGQIKNLTRGLTFQAKPYPPFVLELIEAGGLVEYTKRRLQAQKAKS